METVIIKAPIGKIEYSTDRAHGGEGNIDTLAQSIKAIGIIHPPAVKELKDNKGHYRVIAGRRRLAAVKSLGWTSVELKLYPDKADDEAVALAENVNREDMHPLDEADKFKREIDSGKSADEVAKYYARSVSGIHQRVRLANLSDGVKTMFRDGKINLSGAALIASLPRDDQEKFLKKYGDKKVDKWEINNFLGTVQRLKIKHIADSECAKCKKRTYISSPGLFEDYSGLEDVCFDAECYAGKWKDLIAKLIAGQSGKTENTIIINRGVPEFLPKKTKVVTIGDIEYSILPQSGYSWNETKKKSAANTAWLISLEWHQSSGSYDVSADRVEYKVYEKPTYNSSSEPKDPVKIFFIDLLPDILPEEKKGVAELMYRKHEYPYSFFHHVNESVMETIISVRLIQEDKENMAALYLEKRCGGNDNEGNWHSIGPDYQGLFDLVFGEKFSLSDIPSEPWVQKIFRLLIAMSIQNNNMPQLRDTDDHWKRTENTLFWRFAQITREEYISLYQQILTEAIRAETRTPEALEDETDAETESPFDDE